FAEVAEGHACTVRNFTEGTALTLADIAQNITNFVTKYNHFALLLFALCLLSQAHILPADNAVYGYGLLYHLYRLAPSFIRFAGWRTGVVFYILGAPAVPNHHNDTTIGNEFLFPATLRTVNNPFQCINQARQRSFTGLLPDTLPVPRKAEFKRTRARTRSDADEDGSHGFAVMGLRTSHPCSGYSDVGHAGAPGALGHRLSYCAIH